MQTYFQALLCCYEGLCRRAAAGTASLAGAQFCVMHSPYARLVRKAHAWLAAADELRAAGHDSAFWQQLAPRVGCLLRT